jgi:hypothetical protein
MKLPAPLDNSSRISNRSCPYQPISVTLVAALAVNKHSIDRKQAHLAGNNLRKLPARRLHANKAMLQLVLCKGPAMRRLANPGISCSAMPEATTAIHEHVCNPKSEGKPPNRGHKLRYACNKPTNLVSSPGLAAVPCTSLSLSLPCTFTPTPNQKH